MNSDGNGSGGDTNGPSGPSPRDERPARRGGSRGGASGASRGGRRPSEAREARQSANPANDENNERVWRLRLSDEEANRLSALALEAGSGRKSHAHLGRYIRDILLSPPPLPYPTWPSVEEVERPERPLPFKINLTAEQEAQLVRAARAAGLDPERGGLQRYARWRLLGVLI